MILFIKIGLIVLLFLLLPRLLWRKRHEDGESENDVVEETVEEETIEDKMS